MPDIKLTRTDTTHDLSQKAEKRWTTISFRLFIIQKSTPGQRSLPVYNTLFLTSIRV